MYFDIILVEEPDVNGNIITSYRKVTSPPEYPDIAPKDMSTTNQIKAGAQLDVIQNFKKGDNLRKSDFAESSLINALGDLPDPPSDPEPSPEPSSEPTPEPNN